MVWRRLLATTLVCAVLSMQPTLALADAETADVSVDPTEIIAALLPHQTATYTLQLTNHSDQPMTVHIEVDAGQVASLSDPVIDYAVLVISSPGHPQVDALESMLAGSEHVEVDLWDFAGGTPTVADLAAYDAVVVGNLATWVSSGATSDELGDALADYIDVGGKVIETLLVQANNAWRLAGRYITDGYAPVTVATGAGSGSGQVALVDVDHPLLQGVSGLRAHTYLRVSPQPGASVPAVLAGTEIPFVAANEQVVSINAQLLDDQDDGDMAALLGNAIHYLCGERTPWLTVDKDELHLMPGASDEIVVELNSEDLESSAIYEAETLLQIDGAQESLSVPVELATVQDAEIGRLGGIVNADRPQGPLQNVCVEVAPESGIVWSTETDDSGAFRFWLPAGDYTLRVDLAGYLPYEAALSVPTRARVTQAIALTCDAPWLVLEPERIAVDGDVQESAPQQVQIGNNGLQDLYWALETDDLPAWITLSLTGGELAPGERASIDVSIDAAQAPPGWSVSEVPLVSSDPLQSPAALRVYVHREQAMMLPLGFR